MDDPSVRTQTPSSEVVNEVADWETLRQEAPGLGEMLDRIRSALADRYEVEREIGRGGMAVVYLARDKQLGRQVAIKVIRPELAQALGEGKVVPEIPAGDNPADVGVTGEVSCKEDGPAVRGDLHPDVLSLLGRLQRAVGMRESNLEDALGG